MVSLESKWGAPPIADGAPAAMTEQDRLGTALSSGPSIVQVVNAELADGYSALRDFYYKSAQYQSEVYAEAATIGLLSGICGRAYDTPTNTGPNQYILVLGESGSGKDAIASGTAKLYNLLSPLVPSITEFRGPGELVSSAGLIKWLGKSPCIYSIVGEIGKMLKMMAAPNAPQHLKSLNRTVLQLNSKSGSGETFDPTAYSDPNNNTPPIQSASFTLLGESVPSVFYEALNEDMVVDGWVNRFLLFEETGNRRYRNKAADTYQADPALIHWLANLSSHCLSLMHRKQTHKVDWTAEAEAKFDEFDHWTTDRNNEARGQALKELWNRCNLKAIRLATIRAIARDYVNPKITLQDTMEATELVVAQTQRLIGKFSNGEVGEEAGNESKQLAHMKRCVAELFLPGSDKADKYNADRSLVDHGIIEFSYLWRRSANVKAFKPFPKKAIKETIKLMVDSGWLAYCPNELKLKLGTRAECYVMYSAGEFANCECVKDKTGFIQNYLAMIRG